MKSTALRLGFALLAVACGPQSGRAPVKPIQDGASSPAESPDAALERHVAEMARASDVRNYAVHVDQKPPVGFVPFELSLDAIPPFASVVAYLVNFDRGHRRPLAPENSGCRGAVAKDGTLCPSVVLPGTRLSTAQAAELEALFRMRSTIPRVATGCAGPARHSFVFYSSAGAPVFEWLVDLRCSRGWQSSSLLPKEAIEGTARLCRELNVGLCFLGDPAAREAAERVFTARFMESPMQGVRRIRPFPTSVAPTRPLATLAPHERRELCAWNIQHTVTAFEPGGEPRSNEAGASLRLRDLDTCVRQFPRCSATLDQVHPCMDEAQRGAPILAPFSTSTCFEQRECLWGFELTASSASPPAPSPSSPQP